MAKKPAPKPAAKAPAQAPMMPSPQMKKGGTIKKK